MTLLNLEDEIERYIPFNEQEERDREQMLEFIRYYNHKSVLSRENLAGHFSASAFVVNKERNMMVVVYHNILGAWTYPGGHADDVEDLLSVALREVQEETGLKARVLDNNIFSIQSVPVPAHFKRGKYVSSHIHLDVVYLMEADETLPLVYREDESKGVRWIPFEEADGETILPFSRPLHKKLVMKLARNPYN